ncbi:MCE family protein [Nocardioides sp.]|uniref:MCE family protein n=1 Tax=Nocardioides sp. TaxID=35761 RepID=UPI00286AB75C|nr:MCE family protein [Nocardioides sp.]
MRAGPRQVLRRNLGLGLAAALVTALAGCGVPLVGDDTIEVTVLLPDTAGLFVGNDVGVLGVPVGEISSIEPDGEQVRVVIEIDGERAVPADVGAVVVARSVATDRYVELTPVYDGGARLDDGDTIGLDRTRTPVDFDEVLGALNEFATGIAGSQETTDAVRRFIESGDGALRGNGQLVNDSIRALAEAVDGVAGQRGDFTSTVESLDTLVGTIAANEQTVRTFVRQVSLGSRLLADQRESFRTALRSLDRAVTVVADFAVANRAQVVRALGGTTDLMETIMAKQRDLTSILEVFPLALQNLERVPDGGQLPVRFQPTYLLPLGAELGDLCARLPLQLCELIGGTDPGNRAPAARTPAAAGQEAAR